VIKITPYWKNRQARFMYGQMADAEDTAAELGRLYQQASRELTKGMDKVFTRYQSEWGLTHDQAKELLNQLHGKADLDSMRQAVGAMKPGPAKDAMLREIEAPAYAARIRRMQELQDQVDVQLRQLGRADMVIERRHYLATARESYYHGIYETQRRVGFQFSFNTFDAKAVRDVVASKWDGSGWSKRLWANTDQLAQDVKDQLMMEMLTGRKLEDAAKAIDERYSVGAFKARRLVRTESNFVAGQGQLAAYRECGIDEYIFVATLDTVTCPECGAIDGHRFKTKDATPGVNMNPMHPFCRCTTIDALDGEVLSGLERRARDPRTGESKLVKASTDYIQWRKDNGLPPLRNTKKEKES